MQYKAAILTLSDKGALGQREDLSGAELERLLIEADFSILCRIVLPDERSQISAAMADLCDNKNADLIVTTGGTGFSPRDITPEATSDIIDREVPGIPEAMRRMNDRAILSRGIAGIRNQTLIINMPGSLKAVRECFGIIRPVLDHAMEILTGCGGECGAVPE